MDVDVSTADPKTGCASGRPILRTSCTTCPNPRPICHHPVSPRSTSLQHRYFSFALTIQHFDIQLYKIVHTLTKLLKQLPDIVFPYIFF